MSTYNPIKDLQIRANHMKHAKKMMQLYMKQEQVKHPWQLSSDSLYFINKYYNCKAESYRLSYDLSKLPKQTKINSNIKNLSDTILARVSVTDFKDINRDIKNLNELIKFEIFTKAKASKGND